MRKSNLRFVGNSTISSLSAALVVIMSMFLSVACETEDAVVPNQQQSISANHHISDMDVKQYLPEVFDGRLVFKDETTFGKYQQWVFENQMTPEKMHDLNLSLGFISMRQIYDEGIASLETCESYTNDFIQSYKNVFHATEVDGAIIQDLQAPSVISYFANENGVYQIGDRIIRVAYDYYYVIPNGDNSLLPVVINAKYDEVSCDKVEVYSTRKEEKSQEHYHTDYFDNTDYRIVARLNLTHANGCRYFEAETNSQKKNALNVWIGKKLDGVWVEWATGYYVYNSNQYTCGSGSHGGSSKQTIKADYCIMPDSHYTSTLLDLNASFMQTVHSGKRSGDVAEFTYTNSFLGYF